MHCITCDESAMIKESSVITYDDDMNEGEESGGTGKGWQKCEFNEVAMSPSLEYFVQVSYAMSHRLARYSKKIFYLDMPRSRCAVHEDFCLASQ